jgi:hypothetical protein
MNLMTGEAADEFFGGEVPPLLRDLLYRAQAAKPAERSALLWTAQSCGPQTLAVYYLLYKHHATQREFDLAQKAALRGLEVAARQAGLPDDSVFDSFDPPAGPPENVSFQANGPARFWLFTHKALAFIALRSGRPQEARRRLALIERMHPGADLGNDVIAALLASTDGPDRPDLPPPDTAVGPQGQ